MAHPEAPMMHEAKRQLVQSVIDSLEKSETIDYKLIQEIEKKYPRPIPPPSLDTEHNDGDNEDTTSSSTTPRQQIPTTTTPADHLDSLPCDKPPNASPSVQRFSDQQLHHYFGFRNLKNWLDLKTTGQETIKVVKGNEHPMELGDIANIHYSHHNTKPIPRPDEYLCTVHMDIGYGDCISTGGF